MMRQVFSERLRKAICDTTIQCVTAKIAINITVSIGLAIISPDINLSQYDLIHAADLALYQAKNEGRDRCIIVEK